MTSHKQGAEAHLARASTRCIHATGWTDHLHSRAVVHILFALFSIWPYISVPAIRIILAIACGLVLAFNTAAIIAMLKHYTEDKHFIYGLDLKHLDEMRRRRR
jgi:ascorbate-specific PTS system EIIC-type component UlaA